MQIGDFDNFKMVDINLTKKDYFIFYSIFHQMLSDLFLKGQNLVAIDK